MDAKDGEGIEAFVSLEKEEMAVFEQNEELLSYCELRKLKRSSISLFLTVGFLLYLYLKGLFQYSM